MKIKGDQQKVANDGRKRQSEQLPAKGLSAVCPHPVQPKSLSQDALSKRTMLPHAFLLAQNTQQTN
eukprot:4412233-Amphidinium_carterae.1